MEDRTPIKEEHILTTTGIRIMCSRDPVRQLEAEYAIALEALEFVKKHGNINIDTYLNKLKGNTNES